MDDYPPHLAPAFNEGGGVATPFEEWWTRVGPSFPGVPEEVARYWLHEHWSHSPYQYLRSADYQFVRINWPSAALWEIRSTWDDYRPENRGCVEHGRSLIEAVPDGWAYRTAVYMAEHGQVPSPIIVLDNRDGHIAPEEGEIRSFRDLPAAYVLIEGHRRFNMALYLQSTQRLAPSVPVWLMRRRQEPSP